MDTTERLFFAFIGAVAAFFLFVWIWTIRTRRSAMFLLGRWIAQSGRGSMFESRPHEEILREAAPGIPGASVVDGGLRLFYRGLHGRVDFIFEQTEIQFQTGNLIGQVVEIVPIGFPMSLLSGGKERLRARGSKTEYDRIFKNRAEEHVLLEVGVAYDLRMSPDGVTFRLHSAPGSAAVLGYWISCALRIIDLIPGVIDRSSVQVTEVATRVAGDTLCQVCGASLAEGPVVRCVQCSTPHHEQCWDYTKKCSTFGCAGQRAVR
jgi:hypothetical protein